MKFADGLKSFILLGVLAAAGACDDGGEEESETSAGETGSGDRKANILMLDGTASAGMAVFSSETCATEACHGADGNSGMAENLSERVPALSDDQIVDVLLEGSGTMPPQTHLSDQQLADVLAWLNETFA